MKAFFFERNFLILLSGVFINGIGGGVYAVSGMLLVLHLSGSVLYSGFAFFAVSLATSMGFLVAPLANYFKYKNGLVICGFLKAALLFTIPLCYMTIGLNVYYVILLLFAISLLSQFTYPIESTILPIIVGKDNVIQANSYLHTVREAMDVVFVAVAGILVAFIGSVQAILITAICMLLSALAYTLFSFQQPEATKDKQFDNVLDVYKSDLKAGIGYIRNSLIPKMIVSIVFINFAIGVMTTNLPAFSLIKGDGSEAAYGFYMAAMSLGVMIGTIVTPKVKEIGFGRLIIISFCGTGLLWVGASLLPLIPSLILFSVGTISIGIINILVFSAIQQQVETVFIGRVITVLASASSIGTPFGALAGGVIGEMFTPVVPVFICGIAMFIFSFSWLSSSVLRKLPKIDEAELFPVKRVEEA
ncbi:MFS transporter [Virgibacillus sp. NKC19-16]|uniref:MFS transporter n=1 Tax=Virgibacillus salidurans TaxID=2831673 RepID=UPI001F322FFE|nr:MFS transporter [Virgibacillus sp. NKC19-16]UJL46784.1 MFS transporter [Virgibacillus sp. NKC19-16]